MTNYIAFIILASLSNFVIIKILLRSPIVSAAITPAACKILSSVTSNPGVSTTSKRSTTLETPTTIYFVAESPPALTNSLFEVK